MPPSQPTLSYDPQKPLVPQLAAAAAALGAMPPVPPTSMLFSGTPIAEQPLPTGYDPSQPLAPALLTEASRLSGPSSPNALMGAPFVAPAQSIFDPVNYLEGLQDVLKPYYQPKDSAADAANAN